LKIPEECVEQVPDEEVVELLERARREQEERSATGPEGRA
jgi:hypothetical protein